VNGKRLIPKPKPSVLRPTIHRLHFSFDYRKATQILNYFARQEGGQINKMKALKLIYFADRYHIRKYGRLITNDNYLAMQHGPVPSTSKDIAESNDYLDDDAKSYSLQFIEPLDNLVLKSLRESDNSVLSDSDLEAIQFAWDNFGHYDQFELRDLTHNYPEWLTRQEALADASCLPMDLFEFLQDPTTDANKCFELTEKDKSIRSDQLTELAYIESLWR
jgi:uncharacterized phage-associated protein